MPNDKSVDGLNKMLANLVGDFVVDEKQDSVFEAGFNGDTCQDITIIVGATDAYHRIKDIDDAAANTNIAVTKSNLRTGECFYRKNANKGEVYFLKQGFLIKIEFS